MADRESIPRSVVELLSSLYGELPPLRLDSPLTALNFRSSDAAVIAHGAMSTGNSCITDTEFTKIQTVGDLVKALGHVDPRNISLESGSA